MAVHPRYWCEQTLLVTIDGPGGLRRIEVGKPFARIGSHPSAEVVLRGWRMASRGLYLHATDSGVFYLDLSSTHSNEPPLRGWLHAEEAVKLGAYRVSARLAEGPNAEGPSAEGPNAEGPSAEPDLQTRGSAEAPFPILAMAAGDHKIGRRRLVRQLTVVGRHRPSNIRLTSRSVSAAHCVLVWDLDTLWVVDLLSGNGTKVDGELVEAAVVPQHATLTLGQVDLKYVSQSVQENVAPKNITPMHAIDEEAFDALVQQRIHAESDVETRRNKLRHDQELLEDEQESFKADWRRRCEELERREHELHSLQEAWEEERNQIEVDLTSRRDELHTRREQFFREQESWKQERERTETLLTRRREEFERQRAEVEAELNAQREAFRHEKEVWEEEQDRTEALSAHRREESHFRLDPEEADPSANSESAHAASDADPDDLIDDLTDRMAHLAQEKPKRGPWNWSALFGD